ncbi:MAG: hypothetical protein IPK50_22575 [Fibrobacterota bacterium]|nr:MAG: hypothetical protein IPK50_22575 [Fibrobacterota bacterium]
MQDQMGVLIGFALVAAVFLAIFIGAFFVFRAIMLWYWRVDEIVQRLEQIDRKLGVIADDVPKRGKFQFSFLESIDKKLGKLAGEKIPEE